MALGRLWENGSSGHWDECMSLWFFCSSGFYAMRVPGIDTSVLVSESSLPQLIDPVRPLVGIFKNGNLEDLYLRNMSLFLLVYSFVCV